MLLGFHESVHQVAEKPRKLPDCRHARSEITERDASRHEQFMEQKQDDHAVTKAHHAPCGNRKPITAFRVFTNKPLFLLNGFRVLIEKIFRNARESDFLCAIGKTEHAVDVIRLAVKRIKLLCALVVHLCRPHLKNDARHGEKQNDCR